MVAISISDLIMSIAFVFGPLPIPGDATTPLGNFFPGAHGTTVTCTMQGSMAFAGSNLSWYYSCMLMLYFVLVIRYNVSESWINKIKLRPIMIGIGIVFYGVTLLLGFTWQIFNPSGPFCFIAAVPLGCESDPTMACTRGGTHVDTFGMNLFTIPMMIMFGWISIALIIVIVTVCQRQCSNRRFVFSATSSRGGVNNSNNTSHHSTFRGTTSTGLQTSHTTTTTTSGGVRRSNSTTTSIWSDPKTRQVIIQCMLYGLSFANIILWTVINPWLSWSGNTNVQLYTWAGYMVVFWYPLLGFTNFLIFIRPRFLQKRRRQQQIQQQQSNRESRVGQQQQQQQQRTCCCLCFSALFQAVWNPSDSSRWSSSSGDSNNMVGVRIASPTTSNKNNNSGNDISSLQSLPAAGIDQSTTSNQNGNQKVALLEDNHDKQIDDPLEESAPLEHPSVVESLDNNQEEEEEEMDVPCG